MHRFFNIKNFEHKLIHNQSTFPYEQILVNNKKFPTAQSCLLCLLTSHSSLQFCKLPVLLTSLQTAELSISPRIQHPSYLELLSPCISSSYLYLHLQLSLAPPLTNISVLDVPPTQWQRKMPLPGSICCSLVSVL